MKRNVLPVLIGCWVVVVGCASSTEEHNVKQEIDLRDVEMKEESSFSFTDAWVKAMLDSADLGEPFKEEIDRDELFPNGMEHCLRGLPDSTKREGRFVRYRVSILEEEEILMFIKMGPRAIPALMPHIRDERLTGISFHNPMSSGIFMTPKMVGRVACYLIEAILRNNPHFTLSYRFSNQGPWGVGDDHKENRAALQEAADAYEAWYAECFDEKTCSITCSKEQLPEVKWDYHLDWWDRYRTKIQKGFDGAYDIQRCKDADEVLAGRTVKQVQVGDRGYMLIFSDDAWFSLYLRRDHESLSLIGSDVAWDYGTTFPTPDELALLGDMSIAFDSHGRVPEAQEAVGKILESVGPGSSPWFVFRDGACLRPSVYYSGGNCVMQMYWMKGIE